MSINKWVSLLKSTYNTRELGGYQTTSRNITKRNSLIRSDVPDFPCEEDFTLLKERSITTIIDMRGEKDVLRKPSIFAGREDFDYFNYRIDEGSKVPETVEDVPISYMKIACAANMAAVFQCIANAQSGVMFHCTAGKDRTGVVSAILLCHAGVKDADIIDNYVLTKEYGKKQLELIHENFPDVDMNIVTPNERFMEQFLRMFREQFGNTYNYFIQLGLSEAEIQKITARMIDF